ncbi:MAG TPA: HlyD family efflux transporter periplasmic adaptor subunit [Bacteroidales bacterium]|nr:HlyD family efflux transporter periplasmic adaptor subunit [Bacteroidales bacterium]
MLHKLLIAIQAVILISTTACRNRGETEEEAANTVTPVTVTHVSFKPMKSVTDLPAVSAFLKRSILRATAAGYLQKVEVTQGDDVSAGQLLFGLRTRESLALENLKNADSTLTFKGLISIRAPEAGVITSVKYQSGDFVQEGDELATIADRKSLVFILEVPVEMDSFIAANRHCTIELPDSKILDGTISGRMPEMSLETQTIKYMVKVSSTAGIPENLIANIPLVKSFHPGAQVLPIKAVLSNETESEFWVMKLVNDSVAVKTGIQKGIENEEEVEVTSPRFLPEDRIILTGNYGLTDTAHVSLPAGVE